VALFAILAGPGFGGAAAQERPDSVVADSVQVADTLDPRVEGTPEAPDGEQAEAASDSVSADTIFYNLPTVRARVPSGFATGVWSWDRHAIMSSGAHTLAELFEEIPSLVPLLGGDYGTPQATAAFGQGGAGYRIFRDGFEVYPAQGGVVDLQLVGLAGVEEVRLDRSMGQMRVDILSHRYDDGRPFSVIEAGTGDLDTNMFRGVYADATALLGSVALGLERVDTRGRGVTEDEGGNRTGSWLRYQFHLKDRAGFAVDYRQSGSQTKVARFAPSNERRDLVLRGTWRPVDELVLEAFTGRTTLEADPTVEEGTNRIGGSRSQRGGRFGLDLGGLWANGSFRSFEGDLPSRSVELSGGASSPRWGGISGLYAASRWNGEGATHWGGRAWVTPTPWLTVFGAYQSGEYGSRAGPVADGPPPPPFLAPEGIRPGEAAITDRETVRVGGALGFAGVTLAAAGLRTDADRVLPLGIELDEGAEPVADAERRGVESMAVVPLPILDGLSLQGSYTWWDNEGPYVPKQIYRGSFEFHRVYKPTGNLEVWASVGVRGHDPMLVLVADTGEGSPGLARVPFFQSWYAHLQVRVVTVRLWIGMDNMTLRRNLETFPGRKLPFGRSFFALRWDMWN